MSEVQGNVGSGDFVQNHERALQTLGVTFEQEETSEQIDAAVGSKGFRSEVENLYNDLCWREVEILDHKIENAEFDSGFQDGFQQGELEVVRYVLNRLFNVLATTDEPS